MERTEELTAAEARAVTHLWRLRNSHPETQAGMISSQDLAVLLGTNTDEIAPLTRRARRLLPSTLVASDARLSRLEAETVLAIHASRGSSDSERLPLSAVAGALGIGECDLQPLVRDAKERLSVARTIGRIPEGMPAIREGFGVAVGENPYSWHIVWTVLAVLTIIMSIVVWMGR